MAKGQWEIYGPNGQRTAEDPGDATVVDGSGGESRTPFNWGDMAYTAGGGALGYMLSKWIMGDDEDENGKKKSNGFLKSIVPWLAAAAGAYGGHVPSGSGFGLPGSSIGEKGLKGEFAFKRDKDGNINIPVEPMSGNIFHRGGNTLTFAVGPALLARGAAQSIRYKPYRLLEEIKFLSGDDRKDAIKKFREMSGKRKAFANAHPTMSRAIDRVSSPWFGFGKRNYQKALLGRRLNGNVVSGIIAELVGPVAHVIGSKINERRRNINKAVNYAGGR